MKALLFLITVTAFIACNNDSKTSVTAGANDSNITSGEANNNTTTQTKDTIATGTKQAIEEVNKANKLIAPGKSIGNAALGTNADSIEIIFGKPDMSDAAMGKAWLTWYGKRDEHNNKTQLDIYTTYRDTGMREKTVQQIRTTSSFFSTDNNIHVYSSLDEIKKAFPKVQKLTGLPDTSRKIWVFDDMQKGIAFEIADAADQKICTAIIVHIAGKRVTNVYIPMPS